MRETGEGRGKDMKADKMQQQMTAKIKMGKDW